VLASLGREARSIQVELERTGWRDRFDFLTRWAVEPLDLLRELRKLKPTVVHFSGHGSRKAAITPRAGQAARRDVVVYGRMDSESLGTSLHQVGDCYAGQGKFAAALSWFERAVAQKEKGDLHGHVDPGSLGDSLRRLGDCHVSLGKADEARASFERASIIDSGNEP